MRMQSWLSWAQLCPVAPVHGPALGQPSLWMNIPWSSAKESRDFCEALGNKGSTHRERGQIWAEEGTDLTPSTSFPFPRLFLPSCSLHPPPAQMSIHYASTIPCRHITCEEKPGYGLVKDRASSSMLTQGAGHNLRIWCNSQHIPPSSLQPFLANPWGQPKYPV